MSEAPEFRSGLTWRALFAILTAALLFIPINLYLNLVTGGTIAIAALYVIAILFSELSRMAGSPLTRNEIFIIYSSMGAVVATLPPYYWLVYRAFYVNTPVTFAFRIDGVQLPYLVPDWLAPPYGHPVYMLRTLMHPAWLKPIAVSTAFFAFTLLADVSLGILFSYLFVEVEKLPFPFAQIDYSLIDTITERRSEDVRVFLAGFYPGLIYGFLLYAGHALGVQIIPLPWADLTWLTEKYMPGALIGLATDPSSFVLGLMLDPSTTGPMLIGSVTVWIFLNYLFTVNPQFFPVWAREYYKGMTIATIYQRSFQRIWISPQFGIALGLAAGLVIALRRSIARTFKTIAIRGGVRSAHFPPFSLVLGMFLAGSLGSVILHHVLVPEIPVYVSILTSTIISFFIAMIAARAIGEIGFFPPMPWPWQAIVYFTPYKGYAGWVQAPYISLGSQGPMSQAVKVAYLTGTRPTDYFKALVVSLVLNAVVGFLMMDFFWRLAPIPSSAYPNSMVYWPLFATNDSLFATRQIVLDPKLMGAAAMIALALASATPILARVGISFSPVPLLVGCYIIPPYTIMMFAGSLAGRYLIRKYVGAERWSRVRGILAAGLLAGVGVFIGIGIALLLVARAAWVWPW